MKDAVGKTERFRKGESEKAHMLPKTKLHTKAAPGVQLSADALTYEAQRQTGLLDFGDSWILENLEALVYYINTEAGLPSADVTPVRHMTAMLCDRLRFVEYLKRTPAIFDEVIDPVGVIWARPGVAAHSHSD
jgi:hypothetical protein